MRSTKADGDLRFMIWFRTTEVVGIKLSKVASSINRLLNYSLTICGHTNKQSSFSADKVLLVRKTQLFDSHSAENTTTI